MTVESKGRESRSGVLLVLRPLLRVPLFWKLVVGNLAVVLASAAAAAWLAVYLAGHPAFSSPLAWAGLGIAVLICTLGMNGLLVRLALSPIKDLERTARAVASGDPGRRVPLSLLADQDLERLIRRFNEMLDRLQAYRVRLQDLAARVLAAQESERKRVARELHDDTAQRLAALLLQLELLRRRAPEPGPAEKLGAIREELADTLEDLRRFARGLRPPALDDLGLVAAIEAHLREVEKRAAFRIRFERPGERLALSSTVELAAYRIVQEAVANAWRHSGASRVHVKMSASSAGRLRIVVTDDGRGFDPAATLDSQQDAMGIFGMRERAQHVGGSVEIYSEPGTGTEVRVDLPTTVSPERAPTDFAGSANGRGRRPPARPHAGRA